MPGYTPHVQCHSTRQSKRGLTFPSGVTRLRHGCSESRFEPESGFALRLSLTGDYVTPISRYGLNGPMAKQAR